MSGKAWVHPIRLLAAVAFIALALSGCASMDRSLNLSENAVMPIDVGEQHSVAAVDLAKAMLRAGFTDQEILQDGPDVQKALATAGGCQIRYGGSTAALFAVHGDRLYVSSETHGTFTLELTS
jgi:hypothetical protein